MLITNISQLYAELIENVLRAMVEHLTPAPRYTASTEAVSGVLDLLFHATHRTNTSTGISIVNGGMPWVTIR
jgi:hypothetical protein